MYRFFVIFLMLALQACAASSNKKDFTGCDNLFGVMDRIQTSAQHKDARLQYTPKKHELDDVMRCSAIKQLENNYFYLGTSFDPSSDAVSQKTNEDCWAACSIMLLKHDEVRYSNEEVEKVREKLYNAKSARDEAAIYFTLVNSYKKATYSRPVVQDMLIRSLWEDHILLVGFNKDAAYEGHVKIVYGCYFSIIPPSFVDELANRKYNFALDRVLLVDPAGGVQQEISGDEFVKTADFAISFVPDISTISFIQHNL